MSFTTLGKARDKVAEYNYDEAVALYKEYLKDHTNKPDVWVELADVHKKMNNLLEAAEAYGTAFDIEPENPKYIYLFGKAQAALHHYEDAKALFEKAASLSECVQARIKVGDMLMSLGKPDEALVFYTLLKNTYKDNPKIMHKIAKILMQLNRFDDAKEYLNKELEYRQEIVNTRETVVDWILLAKTYESLERYTEAEKALNRAMVLEKNGSAFLELGKVQFKLGKIAEAQKSLDEAGKLAGSNLQAVIEIADTFTENGQFESAITYYVRALELRNIRADTWASIAYALVKAGKKDEAKGFFEMAKASAAIRELPWADKLHKSQKTEFLDKELGK